MSQPPISQLMVFEHPVIVVCIGGEAFGRMVDRAEMRLEAAVIEQPPDGSGWRSYARGPVSTTVTWRTPSWPLQEDGPGLIEITAGDFRYTALDVEFRAKRAESSDYWDIVVSMDGYPRREKI